MAAMLVGLCLGYHAQAQISLSVNIGSQPLWGPTGYNHAEYYYLPEIECYYSVPKRQFVYLNGTSWIFANTLPPRYRNYDLYRGYKVVLNTPRPYLNFKNDRVRYANYRTVRTQTIIRDSRDSRYYVVKGHPHYKQVKEVKKVYYKDNRGRGFDRGHGYGKGHDRD